MGFSNDKFATLSPIKSLQGKVTKLGEFRPIGWSFTLGSFLEYYGCSANILILFLNSKRCVLILTRMGWATFWATFSQTHLVTLLLGIDIAYIETHQCLSFCPGRVKPNAKFERFRQILTNFV
jgi:hypothetical protein